MSGELRTQGAQLYMLDPDATPAPAVVRIGNITSFGDFGKQSNDIMLTNMESVAVEKIPGIPDNGDMSLDLNIDNASDAHKLLEELAGSEKRRIFALGSSDGKNIPPTIASGDLVLPTTRTWRKFTAGVKSFRASLQTDSIEKASVMLSISGGITRVYKA